MEEGRPFPRVAFPSLTFGPLRGLEAFRGKKVLLHIFASW